MIGRSGERGSGISVLAARHDDDDECMIIGFLVLWSICLSSSLVHFRKGPEYLTRCTAQVVIPLIRFLLDSFVSSSFLDLRYSFEFCFLFQHL